MQSGAGLKFISFAKISTFAKVVCKDNANQRQCGLGDKELTRKTGIRGDARHIQAGCVALDKSYFKHPVAPSQWIEASPGVRKI